VLSVLACFAKTHAVAVPLMLAAYELTMSERRWRERFLYVAPFAAAAGVFAALNVFVWRRDLGYPHLGGNIVSAAATAGPIMLRYLWHLVFPMKLSFYYSAPELSISSTLVWVAWGCVVMAALIALWLARHKSWIGFGWLLALAGLAPALNLVPQLIPMSDHYTLWALPGWLLVLGVVVADSTESSARETPWTRRTRIGGALLAGLVWAGAALVRAPEFSSRVRLLQGAASNEPQSAWAWAGYALALAESPDPDLRAKSHEAARWALRCPDAYRLIPQERALCIRETALALCREGKTEEAWELAEHETMRMADAFGAILTRAEVFARTGRPIEARTWLKPHFVVDPAHFRTLRAACRGGATLPDALPPVYRLSPAESDEFQEQAVEESFQRGLLVLAYATLQVDGPERAFDYAALLVNMYPRNLGARSMLAVIYRQLGLPQAARALLEKHPQAPAAQPPAAVNKAGGTVGGAPVPVGGIGIGLAIGIEGRAAKTVGRTWRVNACESASVGLRPEPTT
jgi:hypothetical protein